MPSMPQPRFHMAPIALAALLVVSTLDTAPAFAQSPGAAVPGATFAISLPTQPLGAALNELARQAGLQLLVRRELVEGKTAPAVSGNLTARQALDRLLAGSSLAVSIEGSTVTLRNAPTQNMSEAVLPPITVTAVLEPLPGELPRTYAGGQVARGGRTGFLGNTDVFDTPFNVTNFTSQLIQDSGARTIADVTANDPSIRNVTNRNTIDEKWLIRGFNLNTTDISIDGLYGISASRRNTLYHVERVEVLKGPNALLNGISPFGSIGGGINLVSKRATDTPVTQLTSLYASEGTFGAHLDLGRRFGVDNAFGARLNISKTAGETAIDRQSDKQFSPVVALDYRGERVRINVDFGRDDLANNAQPLQTGIATGISVPTAPKASANYQNSWEYQSAKRIFTTVRGEWDVLENLTATAAFGSATHTEESGYHKFTVNRENGDMTSPYVAFKRIYENRVSELGLRSTFETGTLKHRINATFSKFSLQQNNRAFVPTSSVINSNLYRPTFVTARQREDFSNLPKTAERDLSSFAIANTLSAFDDRVQLTLAARKQSVKVKGFNPSTGAQSSNYDKSALTPSLGLVLKVTPATSLYANYIEGLTQGPQAPPTGVSNPGQIFEPFKTRQYEIGTKIDLDGLGVSASLFQISQPSAFINPVSNAFSVDGLQRNRGMEINVFGQVSSSVQVLGGIQFLDGKLNKTAGGINNGKTAIAAPKVQLNIGSEWRTPFVAGLSLSGRIIYTSKQFVDINNTQTIPSWTRLDLGAGYQTTLMGQPVKLRANVINALNKNFWESVPFASNVVLTAPRTFTLSAAFDF